MITSIESRTPFNLTKSTYAQELAKALKNNNTAQKIILDPKISSDDAVNYLVNKDQVAFIHGEGDNSIVNINTGANIQAYNTDISLIRLTERATLKNAGTVGSATATATVPVPVPVPGLYVINATDSNVNNTSTGIIDAGTNDEMQSVAASDNRDVSTGSHTAILANGNSNVRNQGIINVASRSSSTAATAVMLNNTSLFSNYGVINLASTPEGNNIQGVFYNRGVISTGSSTFNNSGVIYIGRETQRVLGQVTKELITKLPSYAVYLSQKGSFNNASTSEIVIGENVGNSTGVDVQGVNATVNQGGPL